MTEPSTLDRFVEAQRDTYERALAEIRAGHKQTHWMWFIFPQIHGLGTSATAQRYACRSLDEARAYLQHPVLGPRLVRCAEALLALKDASATDVLGSPDDVKLRSSATLFAQVSAPGSVFHQLLDKFFDGEPDHKTLALLA
jgi:uncharacterized protein (DUF1810 family)